MPSAIERDLATLLPTKSTLPTQLTSLASSLLAQSRATAPKLKPQEEIAREYVCAHIACERLTNKLALDVAQPMPPCAPRIYNKLHRYFISILTANQSVPLSTPKAKVNATLTSPAVRNGSTATTPAKSTKTFTPVSLKRKRIQVEPDTVETALPAQLVQLGQHICRTASLQSAVPHVYAGLERVYNDLNVAEQHDEPAQPSNKRARKLTSKAESLLPRSSKIPVVAAKLPLIVVALAHQAIHRLKPAGAVSSEPDQELEMVLCEALSFVRRQADIQAGLDAQPLIELVKEVADLTTAMQELPWWTDWLTNVPEINSTEDTENEPAVDGEDDLLLPSKAKAKQTPLRRKEKHGDDSQDYTGAAGLLPGLGTMFQPAFDWLSEERQADYARWERGIRQQLAAVQSNA